MDYDEPGYDAEAAIGAAEARADMLKDEIWLGERENKPPYKRIGWRLKWTFDPKWKAYSVEYYDSKAAAYERIKDIKRKGTGRGGYYRLEKIAPLVSCPTCGKRMPKSETCLRCEKLRFDAGAP